MAIIMLQLSVDPYLQVDGIAVSADRTVQYLLTRQYHRTYSVPLHWVHGRVSGFRPKVPVHILLNWMEAEGWTHTSMAVTESNSGNATTSQYHVFQQKAIVNNGEEEEADDEEEEEEEEELEKDIRFY
jgi:hypothetical protein